MRLPTVGPTRDAWPIDLAIDEIAKLKGVQFDPQITDYFLVLIQKLRAEHTDLDGFLGEAAFVAIPSGAIKDLGHASKVQRT